MKIAVILTCHNRKHLTLNCISSINSQVDNCGYDVELFFSVCDDGSNDGTSEALSVIDNCHCVIGDGSLFWAKGMSKAILQAEKLEPDFYLMVNDDVSFCPNMLEIMLNSFYSRNSICAIVGATKSGIDGRFTYGGIKWNRQAINEQQTPVLPGSSCPECDQTNWNCFLLPKPLYDIIGKIDDYYEHSWADFDYANRIIDGGFKIYSSYEYVGDCERNPSQNTWRDASLPLVKRYRLLHKKTGIPVKSNLHYCRKWYGPFWLFRFCKPYLQILKSSIKNFLKQG